MRYRCGERELRGSVSIRVANGKEEDFKTWGVNRWEACGRSGDVFRNRRIGMSCLRVVTLLIVICEEALATKGE